MIFLIGILIGESQAERNQGANMAFEYAALGKGRCSNRRYVCASLRLALFSPAEIFVGLQTRQAGAEGMLNLFSIEEEYRCGVSFEVHHCCIGEVNDLLNGL